MLDGPVIMSRIVKDLCPEQTVSMVVLIICAFVILGGLGGTFYVAYLCAIAMLGITAVFVFTIFYSRESLLGN